MSDTPGEYIAKEATVTPYAYHATTAAKCDVAQLAWRVRLVRMGVHHACTVARCGTRVETHD